MKRLLYEPINNKFIVFGLILYILSVSFNINAQQIEVSRDEVVKQSSKQAELYVDTLKNLVSIESGSKDIGGLNKIRLFIENKFIISDLSYEIIDAPIDSGNGGMIKAVIKGSGKAKIALIAHTDTVYQRGDYIKQPFKVEGDKAYGLGATDSKGGVAILLHTLDMLKNLNIDNFGQITVFINSDEEIGSPSSKKQLMELGKESDLVISFEPNGIKSDSVRLATSGISRAYLTIKGRASHSGGSPELGRNALLEMSHQILQSSELSEPEKGIKFNWTISQPGTVANMIPSLATATGDARANKMQDFDIIEKKLKDLIKNKLINDTEINLKFTRRRPPLEPNDRSREVAKQTQNIAKEIDWKLGILEKPTGGGTDAAYASLESDGAVLEGFGPQGFGSHTDNSEYILISSVQPKLYIVTRLIQEISKI